MHLSKLIELYTKKSSFVVCKLYFSKPDFKKKNVEWEKSWDEAGPPSTVNMKTLTVAPQILNSKSKKRKDKLLVDNPHHERTCSFCAVTKFTGH